MARKDSALKFNAGFNINAAEPLDSRSVVEFESDIISEASWNNGVKPYKGMLVAVVESGNLYILEDPTNLTSWDSWGLVYGAKALDKKLPKYKVIEGAEAEKIQSGGDASAYSAYTGVVFLVATKNKGTVNEYAEFVVAQKTNEGGVISYIWEKLGEQVVDMEGYAKTDDVKKAIGELSTKIEEEQSKIVASIDNVKSAVTIELPATIAELQTEMEEYKEEVEGDIQKLSTDVSNSIVSAQTMINDANKEMDKRLSAITKEIEEKTVSMDEVKNVINDRVSGLTDEINNVKESAKTQYDDLVRDFNSLSGELSEEVIEVVKKNNEFSTTMVNLSSYTISQLIQTNETITTKVGDLSAKTATAIQQTADNIKSYVDDISAETYSYIDQKATGITQAVFDDTRFTTMKTTLEGVSTDVVNLSAGTRSSIQQTENSIKSYVDDISAETYSYIEQKAESIMQSVRDTSAGTMSYIEQTASGIKQSVFDDEQFTSLETGLGEVRADVSNLSAGTMASLSITDEKIESKVRSLSGTMMSYVVQSTSGISQIVQDLEEMGGLSALSEFTQTAKKIEAQVGELSAGTIASLKITKDDITTYVDSGINAQSARTASYIQQEAGNIRQTIGEFEESAATRFSTIDQTVGEINANVTNLSSGTISRLDIAEGKIETEVARINSLSAGTISSIKQTETGITQTIGELSAGSIQRFTKIDNTLTGITQTVSDLESGQTSIIEQTANDIKAAVEDLSAKTLSYIDVQSENINITVNNLSSSTIDQFSTINAKLNEIDIIAKSGESAAAIIAKINADMTSDVTISADKINLQGTTIADKILAGDGTIGQVNLKDGVITANAGRIGNVEINAHTDDAIPVYSLQTISAVTDLYEAGFENGNPDFNHIFDFGGSGLTRQQIIDAIDGRIRFQDINKWGTDFVNKYGGFGDINLFSIVATNGSWETGFYVRVSGPGSIETVKYHSWWEKDQFQVMNSYNVNSTSQSIFADAVDIIHEALNETGGLTPSDVLFADDYRDFGVEFFMPAYRGAEHEVTKTYEVLVGYSGGTVYPLYTENFNVDSEGHLYAKDATIDGHITAKSGVVGGLDISGDTLILNQHSSQDYYEYKVTLDGEEKTYYAPTDYFETHPEDPEWIEIMNDGDYAPLYESKDIDFNMQHPLGKIARYYSQGIADNLLLYPFRDKNDNTFHLGVKPSKQNKVPYLYIVLEVEFDLDYKPDDETTFETNGPRDHFVKHLYFTNRNSSDKHILNIEDFKSEHYGYIDFHNFFNETFGYGYIDDFKNVLNGYYDNKPYVFISKKEGANASHNVYRVMVSGETYELSAKYSDFYIWKKVTDYVETLPFNLYTLPLDTYLDKNQEEEDPSMYVSYMYTTSRPLVSIYYDMMDGCTEQEAIEEARKKYPTIIFGAYKIQKTQSIYEPDINNGIPMMHNIHISNVRIYPREDFYTLDDFIFGEDTGIILNKDNYIGELIEYGWLDYESYMLFLGYSEETAHEDTNHMFCKANGVIAYGDTDATGDYSGCATYMRYPSLDGAKTNDNNYTICWGGIDSHGRDIYVYSKNEAMDAYTWVTCFYYDENGNPTISDEEVQSVLFDEPILPAVYDGSFPVLAYENITTNNIFTHDGSKKKSDLETPSLMINSSKDIITNNEEKGTLVFASGMDSLGYTTFFEWECVNHTDGYYEQLGTIEDYSVKEGIKKGDPVIVYEKKMKEGGTGFDLVRNVSQYTFKEDGDIQCIEGEVKHTYRRNGKTFTSPSLDIAPMRIYDNGALYANKASIDSGVFRGRVEANEGVFNGEVNATNGTLDKVVITNAIINAGFNIDKNNTITAKDANNGAYFSVSSTEIPSNGTDMSVTIRGIESGSKTDYTTANTLTTYQINPDVCIVSVPVKSGATITIPAFVLSSWIYDTDNKNAIARKAPRAKIYCRYNGKVLYLFGNSASLSSLSQTSQNGRNFNYTKTTSVNNIAITADTTFEIYASYCFELKDCNWWKGTFGGDYSRGGLSITPSSQLKIAYASNSNRISLIGPNGIKVVNEKDAEMSMVIDKNNKTYIKLHNNKLGIEITPNDIKISLGNNNFKTLTVDNDFLKLI